MLDVKADGQHTRQAAFNLFLQGIVLIRIVTVAEHSGCFQLLVFVLDDVDSTESNHATEEGGVLLRLNIILLDDTERCLIALENSINLMASQSTMEV